MEKLHNLHYFCINGITRCEFQTKITLCFHAQCTNHSVINKKTKKSELVSRLLIIIFTMSRDRVPKKGFRQKRNIKNNI